MCYFLYPPLLQFIFLFLFLNPFPNRPWFLSVCNTTTTRVLENNVGKGEIACNKQFSFSHSVFYLLGELSAIFIQPKILVCSSHSENFLPFSSNLKFLSVLPIKRTFCHFHQIENCHLQTLSVWKSLKFVNWERVMEEKH